MNPELNILEKTLSDALLKCAFFRAKKNHKTVFINRTPYLNAEGMIRKFIELGDGLDIDSYQTVLYVDYSDRYQVFELSSADPEFSIELKNAEPLGNGIFECEYLINGSLTTHIPDDDSYYSGISNGKERIDKCSFGEKRDALDSSGLGPFATNLHTLYDCLKIMSITFVANCDAPSRNILINAPQCKAFGHLAGNNLFVTTKSKKFVLPEDMSGAFKGLPMLRNIWGLENLGTSEVTNMKEMFCGICVDDLDLSGFDTSNVTDMEKMFDSCGSFSFTDIDESKHHILDVSKFTTDKVKNMFNMFCCSEYDYIKLGNWSFNALEDTFGTLNTWPGNEKYDVRLMSNENLLALIRTNDCLFEWHFICSDAQKEWLQRAEIRSQIKSQLEAVTFIEKDDWYD